MPNTRGSILLRQHNPNRPDTLCLRVRTHLQISQEEFAKQLGVHTKTLGKWEMETCTPLPVFQRELEKLAAKFKIKAP